MSLIKPFAFNQRKVSEAPPALTYVTSGLVLYYDILDGTSWPGSGATWYDISGQSNDCTLYNSPTSVTNAMAFSKSSAQYGRSPAANAAATSDDLRTSDFTYIGLARYTSTSGNGRVLAGGNNWILSHWNNSTETYYASGVQVTPLGTGTNDTNWRYYCGNGVYSSQYYEYYINNTLSATKTGSGGEGPRGTKLCNHLPPGTAEYSDAEISFVMLYNRVLTTAEMTQNYNYFKARFSNCP